MRISPETPYTSLPQLARLAGFQDLVSSGLPAESLIQYAQLNWTGGPAIVTFNNDSSFRPQAVLLEVGGSKFFFIAGVQGLRQGATWAGGYYSSSGVTGGSEEDNEVCGRFWDWWEANVAPRFDLQSNSRVVVGHSLGGAFVTDLVWRYQTRNRPSPQYVTFGAPKAFGGPAANRLGQGVNGIRLMLPSDPVPTIWPVFGEPGSALLPNVSGLSWSHPLNDGLVIGDDALLPAYFPPGARSFWGLDVGSWLLNLQDDETHAMAVYYRRLLSLAAREESRLSEQQEPVTDPVVRERSRSRAPLPEVIIVPVDIAQIHRGWQARGEFLAEHNPPIHLFRLFTWKRKFRKYDLLCNGRVIAWGFNRHNAAAAARAGNELIHRIFSQGLWFDPVSLQSALDEFWAVAPGERPLIRELLDVLTAPLVRR